MGAELLEGRVICGCAPRTLPAPATPSGQQGTRTRFQTCSHLKQQALSLLSDNREARRRKERPGQHSRGAGIAGHLPLLIMRLVCCSNEIDCQSCDMCAIDLPTTTPTVRCAGSHSGQHEATMQEAGCRSHCLSESFKDVVNTAVYMQCKLCPAMPVDHVCRCVCRARLIVAECAVANVRVAASSS